MTNLDDANELPPNALRDFLILQAKWLALMPDHTRKALLDNMKEYVEAQELLVSEPRQRDRNVQVRRVYFVLRTLVSAYVEGELP